MGRGDLTNAEWDRLESFLPRGGARGGRWSDHRRVINGVLYQVRTGVQWRDLPERFGPGETVYKRHRRWSADGTWKMLLSLVQAAEDAAGGIDWDVSVDSTAGRAHQHAAGASKTPPAAIAQKGAAPGTNQVDPVLRKLLVRLEEVVRSANASDVPAEDSPRRGIQHTIPERLDQQRHRHNRGSRGGRPTGFDSERYKKRNTVERAINRLKNFRSVATRYEKRAYIYLGTVTLASLLWLRT
ncbi:IS5 family transposase [Streptomyces phaeochromogenes]